MSDVENGKPDDLEDADRATDDNHTDYEAAIDYDAEPIDTPAAPMRLRAEPPHVTRISRKALATLGLVGGLGLGGALIYALQSPTEPKTQQTSQTTGARSTPDGLVGLPESYDDVPKLGPPLPGDLGRPILDAQNRGQPMPATPIPGAPGAPVAPQVDPAEQRRLAEQEAARTASLFFQSGRDGSGGAATADTSGLPGWPSGSGAPVGSPEAVSPQDRQRAFLDRPADRRTVAADRVMPPASPYVLQAGSVIPAALVTGIHSDLPGQIVAQVTQNVYDSPSGRFLLIPQGTRLIGEYDNGVGFGQSRVLLVWNRLILPDGRSIVLERQPGADGMGHAGLEDGTDYHEWGLVKAAGLSTLLGIGAELAADDTDRLLRALRNGAQDTINQAGQQIVQRQLQVAPTLTIRPGFPVRVVVTRDLLLEPQEY